MKELRYKMVFYGMIGIIGIILGLWVWNKTHPEPEPIDGEYYWSNEDN